MEILQFSTEIAVYVGNGMTNFLLWDLIGNHRRRIDPCRFRWSWV